MNRIAETFDVIRHRDRPGLIAYVTVGFPDVNSTLEIVPALIEGGADLIELGVPFSDPIADGPTIQRSSFHALQQGVTLASCIDVSARLRSSGVQAPIVLMGYLNPLLAYGPARFYTDAAAAGIDGLIVVDATLDEAAEIHSGATAAGLDPIQLIAPTTTDERLAQLLPTASGFVYCVSVTGVTSARGELSPSLPAFVGRVRRHTDLPIVVGFGVSKPEHVASIGQLCEAAAIGSAIVDVIEQAPPGECVRRVREYVEEVTGRRRAADLA